MATPVDVPGVTESTFLHHPAGSRIIHEEVAPKGQETLLVEAVVDHRPQGFGAKALVPERFRYPVAQFRVIPANSDVAFAIGVVATNGRLCPA